MADNNITKLLTVFGDQIQEVEDALQALLTERAVDTSLGAQLDDLGVIVGQPRNGVTDDEEYRRYIRAKITANRSDGAVEDLIKIAVLVRNDTTAGTVEVQTARIATVRVKIVPAFSAELAQILIGFLRDAVGAGVRVILKHSSQDAGFRFKFDTPGQGWDQGLFLDALD